MSPVTHFLTGWVFANCAKLKPRDRAIVTLAWVAPDLDGLGIIPELLTRNSSHPLVWFSLYHHSLHTLGFALVIAGVAFVLATQRWKTGLLALLTKFSSAPRRRLTRRARSGWISMADSVPEAVFFNTTTDVARTMAVECVAQYRDHSCVARDYAVVGVASRVLADRDDFCQAGPRVSYRLEAAFPQKRSNNFLTQVA